MPFNLKGRHLLTMKHHTGEEIDFLLQLSLKLKQDKTVGIRGRNLEGKNIALIFEKPSTRTRCAFVVACVDEGAHPEYLGKDDIQLGKKETVKDTARVLGRMFDGIQFRGFKQETVEELARYSGVPVWNGLTDKYHPTQILADFLTILEQRSRLQGIGLAYVGDGRNNVANSLMIGAAKLGMDFRIVTPAALYPDKNLVKECLEFAEERGGRIAITDKVAEGVKGVDAVYADVWASMGEEDKIQERIKLLKPYQINRDLTGKIGRDDFIFLHCLPAFHNDQTDFSKKFPDICEVTEEIFESRNSLAFPQAENRVHTIKAVMVASLGK